MKGTLYTYNRPIKVNFIDFYKKLNKEERKDIEESILQELDIEDFVKGKLNIPKRQIITIQY